MKNYLLMLLMLLSVSFSSSSLFSSETEIPAKKRILVGAPICQKPAILNHFLTSLKRLNKDSYDLDYYFVDDNDDALSSILLDTFASKEGSKCLLIKSEKKATDARYVCTEQAHVWKEELIWKVAAFKDKMIQYALDKNYDYLFLIDSDLVLHPETIEQLIIADKDIVSNIFWTAWQPGCIEQPQVWISDFYNQHRVYPGENLTAEQISVRQNEFYSELRRPGVYEVGGLGACTLLSKNALAKGVNFKKIENLTFWGEDRHFCVRANAIGLKLHVDTHYPAYHIYRESYLSGVKDFIDECEEDIKSDKSDTVLDKSPKITLSLVMKNEGDRYLKACLENARRYITDAVIIDDGSNDNSIQVCLEALDGIPVHLVKNEASKFSNEVSLRKQQWEETIKQNPDWILVLDADEIFEDRFADAVKIMVKNPKVDAYYFRLYDFWDDKHYREDSFWQAHNFYRPFLVRHKPGNTYQWKETPQHCGRLPLNVWNYTKENSPLRLKHYGWAKADDRQAKYDRYQILDPGAKYGWQEQYDSILDPHPHLVLWTESPLPLKI